jgi:hypothetical protein
MDPSQDLLVTIESLAKCVSLIFLGGMMADGYFISSASHFCRIRLLTLSAGEKHPLAQDPATLEYTRAVPANPHTHWLYSIRVSEDYVGILFINHDVDDDGDENELVVWNWKTSVTHLVS